MADQRSSDYLKRLAEAVVATCGRRGLNRTQAARVLHGLPGFVDQQAAILFLRRLTAPGGMSETAPERVHTVIMALVDNDLRESLYSPGPGVGEATMMHLMGKAGDMMFDPSALVGSKDGERVRITLKSGRTVSAVVRIRHEGKRTTRVLEVPIEPAPPEG